MDAVEKDNDAAIVVRELSKKYRRGAFGATTLREEMELLYSRLFNRKQRSSFREFYALRDISFSVPKGKVCGIVGRNGSGKTTLLKVLSSITEPESGEAIIRGRLGSLLEVGAGFHPELDGIENIFLNGAILGMSKREIRSKLDQIITFADIGPVLETPVKRYSSGMYVRLAFAISAHLEPDILLIDEVLSVGDADFQQKCLGRIKNVANDGRTVLFVSHNLAAVRQLCDFAIQLDAGKLVAAGATNSIVDRYLATFSQGQNSRWVTDNDYAICVKLLHRESGGEVDRLYFNEDYYLVLGIAARLGLRKGEATVSIYNEDGLMISFLSSIEEGVGPFEVKGSGELQFSLQSRCLLPGKYFVGVSLHSAGEEMPILAIERVASFSVLATVINNASRAYTGEWGFCRIACSAEYQDVDNDIVLSRD
jgi:lipopolysaccharide transport system ATP-binding protein